MKIIPDKNKYQDDLFIARWIAGDLSDEESLEFEQWIQTNPEEKKYFDDLKTIWSDLQTIKLKTGLSKEKRWDKISERLYLKPQVSSRVNGKNFWWAATAIAAAAVLIVSFYILWS
ncbi:MAG: hypothetical protein ACE5HI_07100 [bacterium]